MIILYQFIGAAIAPRSVLNRTELDCLYVSTDIIKFIQVEQENNYRFKETAMIHSASSAVRIKSRRVIELQ